jgi:hypothetical protein
MYTYPRCFIRSMKVFWAASHTPCRVRERAASEPRSSEIWKIKIQNYLQKRYLHVSRESRSGSMNELGESSCKPVEQRDTLRERLALVSSSYEKPKNVT